MRRPAESGRSVRVRPGGGKNFQQLGIDAEVVPGITAGVGVPSSLGIPLTHRNVSSSVVFLTGHEDPAKDREQVDWEHVARIETIVIYLEVTMGFAPMHSGFADRRVNYFAT